MDKFYVCFQVANFIMSHDHITAQLAIQRVVNVVLLFTLTVAWHVGYWPTVSKGEGYRGCWNRKTAKKTLKTAKLLNKCLKTAKPAWKMPQYRETAKNVLRNRKKHIWEYSLQALHFHSPYNLCIVHLLQHNINYRLSYHEYESSDDKISPSPLETNINEQMKAVVWKDTFDSFFFNFEKKQNEIGKMKKEKRNTMILFSEFFFCYLSSQYIFSIFLLRRDQVD